MLKSPPYFRYIKELATFSQHRLPHLRLFALVWFQCRHLTCFNVDISHLVAIDVQDKIVEVKTEVVVERIQHVEVPVEKIGLVHFELLAFIWRQILLPPCVYACDNSQKFCECAVPT